MRGDDSIRAPPLFTMSTHALPATRVLEDIMAGRKKQGDHSGQYYTLHPWRSPLLPSSAPLHYSSPLSPVVLVMSFAAMLCHQLHFLFPIEAKNENDGGVGSIDFRSVILMERIVLHAALFFPSNSMNKNISPLTKKHWGRFTIVTAPRICHKMCLKFGRSRHIYYLF